MGDPLEMQEMELGTSGPVRVTVNVGDSTEIPLVKWTSTGSLLVEPNPEDPTSATIYANVPGLGTVRAAIDFNGTHTEVVTDVMVTTESTVVDNKIEFA